MRIFIHFYDTSDKVLPSHLGGCKIRTNWPAGELRLPWRRPWSSISSWVENSAKTANTERVLQDCTIVFRSNTLTGLSH